MSAMRPSRIGDRYRCFVVVRRERGWGGAYGQTWTGAIWRCEDCGFELKEWAPGSWAQRAAADHHECGHAPCAYCGKVLPLRKDGSPRQHKWTDCPAKNGGHRIEREFVKHIGRREYA